MAVMLVPLRQVRDIVDGPFVSSRRRSAEAWVTQPVSRSSESAPTNRPVAGMERRAGGELSEAACASCGLVPAIAVVWDATCFCQYWRDTLESIAGEPCGYDEKRQEAGEDYLAELRRNLGQQAENAVSAARKRRDPVAEATALTDQGVVLMVHGQADQALAVLEESLAILSPTW